MEPMVYGTSVLEHMWENIVWKDQQPILFNAQGSVGVEGDTVKARLAEKSCHKGKGSRSWDSAQQSACLILWWGGLVC